MPGATTSFLLLVEVPLLLVASCSQVLVVMPGATTSFLLLVEVPLLLVASCS